MTVHRGEIWRLDGYPFPVLAISGGMYNDQPASHTVLAMPVLGGDLPDGWTAAVGDGQSAVVDQIGPYSKARLTERLRKISVQALTEVNTLLFKILATD